MAGRDISPFDETPNTGAIEHLSRSGTQRYSKRQKPPGGWGEEAMDFLPLRRSTASVRGREGRARSWVRALHAGGLPVAEADSSPEAVGLVAGSGLMCLQASPMRGAPALRIVAASVQAIRGPRERSV